MNKRTSPSRLQAGFSSAQAVRDAISLQQGGKLVEAAALYEAVLEAEPRHFDSLHNLGLIRHRQGRPRDAMALIRKALDQNADSAEAHGNLGNALQALGHHREAIAHFERSLAVRPGFAEVHYNLGNSLKALDRLDEAIGHYEQALALRPDVPELHNNLGNALQALGRHEPAVSRYATALAIRPDYAEAHYNLGNTLRALGRNAEAIVHYERALALRPNLAEAHNNLGKVHVILNRPQDAMAHYQKAVAIKPAYAEAHYNLGNSLKALDRCEEAIVHYERALAIRPDLAEAHNNLGNALVALNRPQEAIAHYERALNIQPSIAETHNNLGKEWEALGRLEEARRAFEKAVALAPKRAEFYRTLANVMRFTAEDPHLAAMETLAQDVTSLPWNAQVDLHFALGKALADIGEHERSFRHVLEGNALKRQHIEYDEAATLGVFERIRSVFTRELMREKQGRGNPSHMPVFILGMPRSGSTLVEQILASHPKVFGAGEITDFRAAFESLASPRGKFAPYPECVASLTGEQSNQIGTHYLSRITASAGAAERITDKLPHNFLLVGLIHLALPNARIIHTRRDPVDTCLSYFSKLFAGRHPYTNDLGELGRYYRAYSKLMDHWRSVLPDGVMLEVDYEDVIADLESAARRMIAHCGLAWDDACLSFYQTQRVIRTGSTVEVRRPIYQTSVGRARPYEALLRPLLDVLDRG